MARRVFCRSRDFYNTYGRTNAVRPHFNVLIVRPHCTDEGGRRGSAGDVGNRSSVT
jgi:hypothetical protein